MEALAGFYWVSTNVIKLSTTVVSLSVVEDFLMLINRK
jgi:hypothetical protein